MSTSERLRVAVNAEIDRQQKGLDALEGVASCKVEVYFKPGGAYDVNLLPQTKGQAEPVRIQVYDIAKV